MPRNVPASIAALRGQKNVRSPIWLVEWELASGTRRYSSGEQITWNGGTWEKNRVKEISQFKAGIVDGQRNDTPSITIVFDNRADDGSANFPFTLLTAGEVVEDRIVSIYAYSPDAQDAVAMPWGYSRRLEFDGTQKTATLKVDFFWDLFDLKTPSKMIQQIGFIQSESSGKTAEQDDDELYVPLYYAAGASKMRPIIYNHWDDGIQLYVNFIISGIHTGLPFSPSDITASDVKLFDNIPASDLEWYQGNQTTPAGNLTRFPSNQAHTLVAHGCAVYRITNELKDRLDNISSSDIKLETANGRPLVDTSLPSENAPLILRDYLRDPTFSLGLAASLFDTAALTTAANYAGTRYQARYEFKEPKSVIERVQQMLADFAGFLTFEGKKIQINCERNNETSVATFATIDSGQSGRVILGDSIPLAKEKDSSELLNKAIRKFRRKKRNRRIVIVQDTVAQSRAGGTMKKEVPQELDNWDIGGVYDEEQNKILGAIAVRKAQSGNIFLEPFESPFWDSVDIAPGDIITVRSVDIFNNASNRDFRVINQSINTNGLCSIGFECQLYKQAIYNDDYLGLGVDLSRLPGDVGPQGRPPDVTPVSLQLIDVVANDTEGKDATIRATCTVPAFNAATEQADGIFREPPISEVEFWYRYTDEPIKNVRRAGTLAVLQAASAFNIQFDFQVPFFKSRSVEVFFVSIAPNRARSPFGYVPDPVKVSHLTGSGMTATGTTATLQNASSFAADDYVQTEREINRILSKASNTLTFYNSGGVRTTFFDSVSIAHPVGTEIAVAKQSYPSLTLSLAAPRFTYPVVTGLVVRKRSDGVRVKYTDPSAENRENFLVYWSTASDAHTNAAKLGVNNPAWYLADPLTPPAGVNLRKNDDLDLKIHQEDIGPAGTVVYIRVAARNGKHNFSSTLSSLASNSPFGDTAAPSAVQSLNLVWSSRKGWKTTWNRPADNINSLRGYYVAYFYFDGVNYSWMHPNTGALVATNTDPNYTGSEVFVADNHHTTHLKKSEVVAPFLANGVKVRVIPANTVDGAEARGTSATFGSFVTISEGDQLEEDAGAASAVQNLSLTWGAKKGYKATWKKPASNVKSLKGYWVVYFDNAATNFMNPHTGAVNSPNDEASARIFVSDTHHTTHLKHSDLASAFLSGVKVKVIPVNVVAGADTEGTSATSSLVAPATDDALTGDTNLPNNGATMAAPEVRFKKKGLRVRFDLPTLQMNTFRRAGVNVDDNAGNSFNFATGLWVAGTSYTFIGQGSSTTLEADKTEIFSGGRTSIRVYYLVENSQGQTGSNVTTVAKSAAEDDPQQEDSAAASAVQSLSLAWSNRKGFKATWVRPASNTKSLRGYKVVYMDNAGTNFMNPHTGALAASEAAATIFVTDTHHTTNLRYADLASQFQAGVKVKVTPVNIVAGVETDGASSTSSFVAAVKDDPRVEDSAAASAVQSLSLTWSNRKGFKTTWARPASNIHSLIGYKVVYFDNAAGTFMNPNTGAVAGSEAAATVFVTTPHHTTNLKFADLAAAFQAGVKVRVTPVNIVAGAETDGASSTSGLVAPASDDPDDAAAPGALPTPRLKFKPRGLIGSFDMDDVTNSKQILFIEWHIDDGTNSLNVDDPDSFAAVAGVGAWYVRGREAQIVIPVSARQLQKIFGSGKTITLKYRITNPKGTTTSGASAGLALDTLGDFNDKKSFVTLVKNGTFTQDRSGDGGTTSQLRNFEKCDTSHNRPTSNGNIIDTASSNIEWDKSGRRVRFEENVPTRYLFYDLGKILIPGQYLSVYFIAQVDSGTPTPTFKLRIMADVDTDADGIGNTRVADHDNEIVFNTLQLSTSYKEVGMSIKLKDNAFANQGANVTVGHWIVLEVSGGGGSIVRISDFSVLDGLTPAPALRAAKFERDNFDVTATVTQGGTGVARPPSGEYPSPEGAVQL
jgi:fibronectin type 3 domain-containing protein